MTNSAKNLAIERYLEDTITEYLKDQTAAAEYPYNFDEINEFELQNAKERDKTLQIIEELINDILEDVDRTTLFQEKYKEAYKGHHQYALFELENVLPGFSLDDTLIHQLCFRETLLISNVDEPDDDKTTKPKPVGALCLKIEFAKGIPLSQQKSASENKKSLLERIKKIKEECMQPVSELAREKGDSDEEKLRNYEAFLNEQSKLLPKKFVVHLSSEFDVEGKNAGSRIVSWVDTYMHTLEERRTEYIFQEDKSSDQQILYFALQENKYYVKHRANLIETNSGENRKYYPLTKAKNLVGEGANFVLMRYLAITRYKGTFELSTVYINGDLCRNIYECRGPRQGWINGVPVEVCKIYRTIMEECGIVHQSVTVMTVYGLIVSQEWEGCPYIIHVNPLQITEGKPVPYDYLALKKMWECNMELLSKFLDCKSEAEKKMKTYLKDHEDIKDLLADYLQSVLLLKPDNIVPFTVDYFSNFEPLSLPQMPYFGELDDNGSRDKEDTSEMFW